MSTARDMHAWYRALFEEPERIGLTPGAAAGPALHYMGHILDLVMRRLVAGYPACWLTLYWHHGSPHAASGHVMHCLLCRYTQLLLAATPALILSPSCRRC